MKGALLSFIFIFSFSLCEGQSWDWGRQGHNIGLKATISVALTTDMNGNAFLTGGYYPEISFGADTLVDSNYVSQGYQAYFAKYNASGSLLWATQFIGEYCYGQSLVADASNNIIVGGGFEDTIRIGSTLLIGKNDFFLAKCDNNGIPLWAVAGNGAGLRYANTNTNALAIDKANNIFISGYFLGNLQLGAVNLSGSDSLYTIFIAKYDSNGTALWAKKGIALSPVATNGNPNQSYSVAIDHAGNSFIAGIYNDSIIFGSDTLISPILNNSLGGNLFLVKYDSVGNLLWARQSVLPSAYSYAIGYSLTTDKEGNVYYTGYYNDTISFGTYSLIGGGLYFVKYNSNGKIIWVKGATGNAGSSLSSDEFDNIYMSGGGTSNGITFGSLTLTAPNTVNAFIIKFDTSGNALCGSLLYNGIDDQPVCVAVDKTGKYVYTA